MWRIGHDPYIDLNPVHAGMVKDPADYRWSSFGEELGSRLKDDGDSQSGVMGNGKRRGRDWGVRISAIRA